MSNEFFGGANGQYSIAMGYNTKYMSQSNISVYDQLKSIRNTTKSIVYNKTKIKSFIDSFITYD